jgi:hypothetical protein
MMPRDAGGANEQRRAGTRKGVGPAMRDGGLSFPSLRYEFDLVSHLVDDLTEIGRGFEVLAAPIGLSGAMVAFLSIAVGVQARFGLILVLA